MSDTCEHTGLPIPKPPLGLRPAFAWLDHRRLEIVEAMHRFAAESKPIPDEWLDDLRRVEAWAREVS